MTSIPYGFCHCGCGEKTNIAKQNDKRDSMLKGQPYKYKRGHGHRVPVPVYQGDGLCECGCGLHTRISPVTRLAYGWYAGHPVRFVDGHQGRGRRVRGPHYEERDCGHSTLCWIWRLKLNDDGYGTIGHPLAKTAHRAYYIEAKGPIPEGLELDHLCNVRACCNPDHLEAVTHMENIRRAWARRVESEATIKANLSVEIVEA